MEDQQKEVLVNESDFRDLVKVATDIDFKALKHYNMYVLRGKRHAQVVSFISSVALIGLGLAMVIVYLLNALNITTNTTEPSVLNLVLGGIAIIFGVYSLISAIRLEKSTDKSIANYFANHAVVHQVCEFEGEQIYLHKRNELRHEPYDWSYVTEMARTPDYYFLMINRQTPVIISRDPAMMREGQEEDLDKLMNARGEARPFKKYETNFCKIPVTFVQTFIENEPEMEEEAVDPVATVEHAIDALPVDVALSDAEEIKRAQEAFEALSDADQYRVKNYVKLVKAQKALAALENA